MPFCPYCGTENSTTDQYCRRCRHALPQGRPIQKQRSYDGEYPDRDDRRYRQRRDDYDPYARRRQGSSDRRGSGYRAILRQLVEVYERDGFRVVDVSRASVQMVARREIQTGWAILFLFLGLIPFVVYLIHCNKGEDILIITIHSNGMASFKLNHDKEVLCPISTSGYCETPRMHGAFEYKVLKITLIATGVMIVVPFCFYAFLLGALF